MSLLLLLRTPAASPVLLAGIATPLRGPLVGAPVGTAPRGPKDGAPIPMGCAPYTVGVRGERGAEIVLLPLPTRGPRDGSPVGLIPRGPKDGSPGAILPPPSPAYRLPLFFHVLVAAVPATPPQATYASAPSGPITALVAQLVGGLSQSATCTETIASSAAQYVGTVRQTASESELVAGVATQVVGRVGQAATVVETIATSATQHVGGVRQTATTAELVAASVTQHVAGVGQSAEATETIHASAGQTVGGVRQTAAESELVVTSVVQHVGVVVQVATVSVRNPDPAAISQSLAGVRQRAYCGVVPPIPVRLVQRVGRPSQLAFVPVVQPTPPVTAMASQHVGRPRQLAFMPKKPFVPHFTTEIAQAVNGVSQTAACAETIGAALSQHAGGVIQSVNCSITPPGPPVTGYLIWLDASDPGNTSTKWVDQSGNGYNATVTGGTAPVLTANALNGLAAYLFSGATTYTLFGTGAVPQASANFAVFCVFKCLDTALYTGPCDANYVYDWSMQYGTTWGPEYWSGGNDYLSGGSTDNNVHVMALTRSSVTGEATAWLDGVALHSYTANAPYSGLSPARVMGNFGYNSQTFAGYVAEFIEYSPATALTTGQIGSIFTYLMDKWGVG